MTITLPHHTTLTIEHLVLDYNGTLADGGTVSESIKAQLMRLEGCCRMHVITADTFGTVAAELSGSGVAVHILNSDDHTAEKAAFIRTLGAENCAAIGNGNNDRLMLQSAAFSIAICGPEGCAKAAWEAADILCTDIGDALRLFEEPKRLVATLRR